MTSRSMGVLLAQRDAEITTLRTRLAEVEGALRDVCTDYLDYCEAVVGRELKPTEMPLVWRKAAALASAGEEVGVPEQIILDPKNGEKS